MTTTVNLIVTCTKKKTRIVPKDLHIRELAVGSCRDRAQEWFNRLGEADEEDESVESLYAGDHWSVARELHGMRRSGFEVRTWVASAGWGLLGIDERVQPYSATFSRDHEDSVVTDDVPASEWWKQLTDRKGGRSVRSLAAKNPGSPILVAASTTYLRAMHQDLIDAVKELKTVGYLSIVSAGTRTLKGLDRHLLPCDARMKSCVGGALRSLNVRVAERLLCRTRKLLPLYPNLKRRLKRDLEKQPGLVSFDRKPMDDSKIQKYMSAAIKENAQMTHSRLLRQFRDDGNACEQGRFRDLFTPFKEKPGLNGASIVLDEED